MSRNYYDVLEIPRTATHEQIAGAYDKHKYNFFHSFRRLALKYHPLRNPSDLATNTAKFNEICEAYDVLSHSKL
jgi:molecular chaperone DnaJ